MKEENIYDLHFLEAFVKALNIAGFGSGYRTASSIIDPLIEPKSPVLRQFYLAAMGMGTFHFKRPTIVDMRGPGGEVSECYGRTPWYTHPRQAQKCTEFSPRFNLCHTRLQSLHLRSEGELLLSKVKGRLNWPKYSSSGTIWHACWFYQHPECLPTAWKRVLKNGGNILFPRVASYIMSGRKRLYPNDPHYPYMFDFTPERGVAMTMKSAGEIQLIRGRDFIACVPEVKE